MEAQFGDDLRLKFLSLIPIEHHARPLVRPAVKSLASFLVPRPRLLKIDLYFVFCCETDHEICSTALFKNDNKIRRDSYGYIIVT